MRATHLARCVSQAVSSEQASRLVSEAARRASTKSASLGKRPRSLRYYTDIIAVGLASVVAATALTNRRIHEERVAFLEAELARAHQDRDRAAGTLHTVKLAVVERAPEAIKALEEVSERDRESQHSARAIVLQNWLDDAFGKLLNEAETDLRSRKTVNGGEAPKMV